MTFCLFLSRFLSCCKGISSDYFNWRRLCFCTVGNVHESEIVTCFSDVIFQFDTCCFWMQSPTCVAAVRPGPGCNCNSLVGVERRAGKSITQVVVFIITEKVHYEWFPVIFVQIRRSVWRGSNIWRQDVEKWPTTNSLRHGNSSGWASDAISCIPLELLRAPPTNNWQYFQTPSGPGDVLTAQLSSSWPKAGVLAQMSPLPDSSWSPLQSYLVTFLFVYRCRRGRCCDVGLAVNGYIHLYEYRYLYILYICHRRWHLNESITTTRHSAPKALQ